ncbi:LCP family protein [Streptacidiphilus neutrinimicus]|uniref:LCP family protein n=1 Tax=Streptacidiphilus neutrinimicus TaxID=105420 RepID=UPI0005AAA596|nr:LCP family protein [Streptacidiphilus neutrinimicus]
MGASAFVILVAAAGCAWIYQLNSNIKHSALDSGSQPQKGAVIPGALNVLVIGSDTRNSAADSGLGGSDDSLPHADVEMLVHVSADHQNATVMSIPRDTDVQMPSCTAPSGKTYSFPTHSQITNSLNYGPGCTVAAVNALTGVHIDHFMMVDFSGVVSMSDAVGGVQVCVTHNVYDPGSHLKLSAGTHTLEGDGALAFLRSRHAFGGSSDVDRTAAQHIFLSALIHKMKSASTLADPTNVFNLAEAASKAFAVDDGLAGATHLVSLADTLGGVPSSHITFVTMPSAPDPHNPNAWLVPASNAQQLFNAIANDQSLTPGGQSSKPSAGASASASGAQTVDPSTVEVHVFNGTGITGRAAAVQSELVGKGYTNSVVEQNPMSVGASKVEYSTADPKYKAEAKQVAAALGLPSSSLTTEPGLTTVHVVVGPDLKAGSSAPGPKPSANIGQATVGAHAENAGDAVQCAQASSFPLGGLPASAAAYQGLTVEQAYAKATKEGIPDSDKTH